MCLIKADASRQKGVEGHVGLSPGAAGRVIEEYLAVLDVAAIAFGMSSSRISSTVIPSSLKKPSSLAMCIGP
jgi:hypothetical protein